MRFSHRNYTAREKGSGPGLVMVIAAEADVSIGRDPPPSSSHHLL